MDGRKEEFTTRSVDSHMQTVFIQVSSVVIIVETDSQQKHNIQQVCTVVTMLNQTPLECFGLL